MNKTKLTVDKSNIRLDIYLSEAFNISRSQIKKMFDADLIYLNRKLPTKLGVVVQLNDIIEIKEVIKNNQTTLQKYNLQLEIIYEDKYFLIVNKPSGLLTHATQFHEQQTLENALYNYLDQKYFKIVHRLDKHTSGLLIVTLNEDVSNYFMKAFLDHKVSKQYYALVHNKIHDSNIKIDLPIARSYQSKLKMQTLKGKNLKSAITYVNLIENFKNSALVSCKIVTGRTHQIRVHLKHINHPIINDHLYGIEKQTSEYGQYLVAYKLSFIHPISLIKKEFSIKIPDEFLQKIKTLK